MPKYGLRKVYHKLKISPSVQPIKEEGHVLEDCGCGWLIVVDEVGVRKQYVAMYDRDEEDGFYKVTTYLGDREMLLNPKYIVRDEEVRIWEEKTTHTNPNFRSPITRVFITHPEALPDTELVESKPSDKYNSELTVEKLFILVGENNGVE